MSWGERSCVYYGKCPITNECSIDTCTVNCNEYKWDNKTEPDSDYICGGCGARIDPDVCWCGDPYQNHILISDHTFVPIGCNCMRNKDQRYS